MLLDALVCGPGAVGYPVLHLPMPNPPHIQGQGISPAVSPNPGGPPWCLGPIYHQRGRNAFIQHLYQLSYRTTRFHFTFAGVKNTPNLLSLSRLFSASLARISLYILCKKKARHLAGLLRAGLIFCLGQFAWQRMLVPSVWERSFWIPGTQNTPYYIPLCF